MNIRTEMQKGFTLLENVLAVFLLGIVITATIFSITTAKMYTTSSRHHTAALNLARAQIERILAGAAPSPGPVTIDAVTGVTGTLSVSNPTVNTAQVTVSWTEEMWGSVSKEETIIVYLP